MVVRTLSILLICLLCGLNSAAQERDTNVVQFSGIVLTEEDGELVPLPYVNVFVKGTRRGTYSSTDGLFSVVARTTETIVFSSIGFKTIEYEIPDSIDGDRYTVYQLMSKDTFLLPETVIYPWPSREHFKLEFIAMNVEDPLEERAKENLSEKALAQIREYLPSDGGESVNLYLRQQANAYVYEGQIKPITVLNAFAWADFFKAWKRGDFKKKKK